MDDDDILPQQKREFGDPSEGTHPVPWSLRTLVAILLAFGVVYIGVAQVDVPSSWGDGRSPAELSAKPQASTGRVDGAAAYASTCAACHQATGAGLPGVFPPLAGSEWVDGNDTTLAAIVLNGVSGPLTVKGVKYNGVMPTFKGQLPDDQVAAILTHLRSQWGNASPAVTPATVAKARTDTQARTGPFAGDQELNVPR